jgi:hypothetical protein
MEGKVLALPVPASTAMDVQKVTDEIAGLRKTVLAYEKAALLAAKVQRDREQALNNAPQLLIEHIIDAKGHDALIFKNSGPHNPLSGIYLNPLTWKTETFFHLYRSIPSIPAQNVAECQFHMQEITQGADGNVSDVCKLTHALKRAGDQAKPSAIALYSDPTNILFAREFAIRKLGDGRIVWQPGPVRYASEVVGI